MDGAALRSVRSEIVPSSMGECWERAAGFSIIRSALDVPLVSVKAEKSKALVEEERLLVGSSRK